jgi:hypothetical protein
MLYSFGSMPFCYDAPTREVLAGRGRSPDDTPVYDSRRPPGHFIDLTNIDLKNVTEIPETH